jgi:hypothetical protein
MYRKLINKIICGSILIILIGFMGCEDVAQNTIVKKSQSPNVKYIAIAFIRDAGATTDFSPQVSVIKSGELFENRSGNAFIGNKSEYIDIEWIDSSTLKTFYDCGEKDLFKKEKKIYEVTMEYEKRNINE